MRNLTTAFTLARFASVSIPIGFLYVVYWLFNTYDWNYPHVKLALFTALFLAVAGLQFLRPRTTDVPKTARWAELGFLLIVLQATFLVQVSTYGSTAFDQPISDIGYTTVHAVKILINEGQNPYSRADINHDRKDLDPGFRGFHYGPFMMAGYIPSSIMPIYAYKMMSFIYVLISALLLILLVIKPDESDLEHITNAMFVLAAYFIAKRFWLEVLLEGANDVFHIMLILVALLGLKKGKVFLAGIFTGLSMAAKFAPGAFLVPFMPLRDKNFWFGFALGLTPYLPFAIWDPAGLWRNVFWLRVVIPPDWTSLYWITPKEYHFIFGAVMLAACIVATVWAVRRKLEFQQVLVGFTLLLIVVDVTQKQIHGNHLIWFFPLFALLFMEYRERLYELLVGRAGTPTA